MTEHEINCKRRPNQFRLIGAAALVLAFFLPVSSCTSSVTADHENTQVVSVDAERSYRYPFKELAFNDPRSALIVLAYSWPAAALLYRKFSPNKTGRKFTGLECFLCFLTLYVVSTLVFLERREIGAYLAIAGAAFYLLAASTVLTEKVWRWFR